MNHCIRCPKRLNLLFTNRLLHHSCSPTSSRRRKHSFLHQTKRSKHSRQKNKIPALLSATASPYVFVAKAALDDSIDSFTLFGEGRVVPQLFSDGTFHYCNGLPQNGLPEVAFLGRSNVGKSSLINSLLRRNLCITSKSPGRTQRPYYYGLFPNTESDPSPADAMGFIMDLPGYGFGAAPKETVESWQEDTQNLLINRRDSGVLKRLFLLVDARRDGPTEMDRTVMTWLEDAGIAYSIVLTKIDQVNKPKTIKLVNELCMRYTSHVALEGDECLVSPIVHTTSSKRNWGINELMFSVETEFVGYEEDEE